MNLLISYIRGFLGRSGSYILLATIISRVLSFVGAWIALQVIDNKELGTILFAFGIIQFIIPIGGFGLHQSLIRYGALLKTDEDKEHLFSYVFKKGGIGSLTLVGLIVIVCYFIPFHFERTYYYLIILSSSIITNFIFEIVKIRFRINHQNKVFAKSEVIHSIILVILILSLSYLFQGIGYAISLIIAPLLVSIVFIKRFRFVISKQVSLSIIDFSFWKYGFFTSLSNTVTQLLFVIDFLLIGYFLKDAELVTDYRYISIIPFSLLFLPRVFITTDFVKFTENIYDEKYIHKYIKSYLLLFSFLSLFILIISLSFSREILGVFQNDYDKYSLSFIILIIGIIGIYITRGLFGNLLSSIGKATMNYYIVLLALILNIIGNFWAIPKYGIIGAASVTASLMWLTGLLSWLFFKIYYKKLLLKKLKNKR